MKIIHNDTIILDATDISVARTPHEDGSVLITITAYVPPPPDTTEEVQ